MKFSRLVFSLLTAIVLLSSSSLSSQADPNSTPKIEPNPEKIEIAQNRLEQNDEKPLQASNTDDGVKKIAIVSLGIALTSLLTSGFLFWRFLQLNKSMNRKLMDQRRRNEELLRMSKDHQSKLITQQRSLENRLEKQGQQGSTSPKYSNQEPTPRYPEKPTVLQPPRASQPSVDDYTSSTHPMESSGFNVQNEWGAVAPKHPSMPEPSGTLIVKRYNTNPSSIESTAEGVSETEDSIYRRRRDSSITQATLRSVSNYSYWVVTDADGGHWLVPKTGLKLNPMNFDTFQALFQFQGQPEDKLQLVKPAKVTPAGNSEWELFERGEVQFV
jgi:hypothetical protein